MWIFTECIKKQEVISFASPLEVFNTRLDGTLDNLIQFLIQQMAALPVAGGLELSSLEVPSNPSHSMISSLLHKRVTKQDQLEENLVVFFSLFSFFFFSLHSHFLSQDKRERWHQCHKWTETAKPMKYKVFLGETIYHSQMFYQMCKHLLYKCIQNLFICHDINDIINTL